MTDERKCGKCKNFVLLNNSNTTGHCSIEDMPIYYSPDDDCSWKRPYGFKAKDGERE